MGAQSVALLWMARVSVEIFHKSTMEQINEEPPLASFDLIPNDEVAEIFGDSADVEDSDEDSSSMLVIAESTEKARERALAA